MFEWCAGSSIHFGSTQWRISEDSPALALSVHLETYAHGYRAKRLLEAVRKMPSGTPRTRGNWTSRAPPLAGNRYSDGR